MGLTAIKAAVIAARNVKQYLGIRTEEKPEPMIAEFTFEVTGNFYRSYDVPVYGTPFQIAGNRNLVIFDGKPYVCVTMKNNALRYVGNEALAFSDNPNAEDNGLPFAIKFAGPDSTTSTSVYATPGTHTLEIQNLVTTTTPIDPKHLPEGGVGYTETELVPVLEFTHNWPAMGINASGAGCELLGDTENLWKTGHTNYVFWDGKLYECKTETNERFPNNAIIGNAAKLLGSGDTGEPFVIRIPPGGNWIMLCYDELNTTHTIKVCDKTETAVPIDIDYLPVDEIVNTTMEELGIREEETGQIVLKQSVYQFSDGATTIKNTDPTAPYMTVGNRNIVVWDGTPYVCETWKQGVNFLFGNPRFADLDGDNGQPFCVCATMNNDGTVDTNLYTEYGDYGFHTVEIQNLVKKTTPINSKYLPEGGFGYTESAHAVLTFDGNNEGKPVMPFLGLIKISDEAIRINDKTSMLVTLRGIGMTMDAYEVAASMGESITIEESNESIVVTMAGTPYVVVLFNDTTGTGIGAAITTEKGTYVMSNDEMYISRLETVITHKIDPKYLPESSGGSAPVVIDLPIDKDTLFSGTEIPVDDQMAETLEKAAQNHSPVYIQIPINDSDKMILKFDITCAQSGQDYKYYTFVCVTVDLSTASFTGFMVNYHTGDKTINGSATVIKSIFG